MSFMPPLLILNTRRTRATTGILKRKRLKSLVTIHNSQALVLSRNYRLYVHPAQRVDRELSGIHPTFIASPILFPRLFHYPSIMRPTLLLLNSSFVFSLFFFFLIQTKRIPQASEEPNARTNITLPKEDPIHERRATGTTL